MKSQKQVWNNIAKEWYEYKEKSSILTDKFLDKQTGKVLDIGSGSGRHLRKINAKNSQTNFGTTKSGAAPTRRHQKDFVGNGKMYLVDFSEEMIELAKNKAEKKKIQAEFEVANMTKLPYENNFFDSAINISALHCVKKSSHKKAVKELHRVLKPKAKVLVGVWNRESKRFRNSKTKEKYIGWKDKGKRYYYLFDEKEIHNLFVKNKFKIISKHNSELMIRFIAEKFN